MEDPFDAAIAELLRGREQVIERAMEFEQQGMAAEDQLGPWHIHACFPWAESSLTALRWSRRPASEIP